MADGEAEFRRAGCPPSQLSELIRRIGRPSGPRRATAYRRQDRNPRSDPTCRFEQDEKHEESLRIAARRLGHEIGAQHDRRDAGVGKRLGTQGRAQTRERHDLGRTDCQRHECFDAFDNARGDEVEQRHAGFVEHQKGA
jgi:hypothetical protein